MVSKIQYVFALAMCIFAFASSKAIDDHKCELPIGSKHHYRYQWPLVYKEDGALYSTVMDEDGVRKVQIGSGDEVLFSCGPNYLKNFNRKEVLSARCDGTTGNFTLPSSESSVSSSILEAKDFACDLRVVEEVLSDVDGCTDKNWIGTSFGYVDPAEKLTHILGEACYDPSVGKTIFAHVKLGDKDASYLQKQRKNFLNSRHPDGRYKIDLFRGLHFDEIYDRIRTHLNVRHAPPLRMANYIDEPLLSNDQFQAVKKLAWNYFVMHDELSTLAILKTDIKSFSASHNLDIYTGSHGVGVLKGANNEKMSLYLQPALGENGRFPMPEMLWILVKYDDKAIAFGVSNEASNGVVETEAHEAICRSQCDKVKWISALLQAGGEGNTLVCCTYEDFRKSVPEVPVLRGIQGMLIAVK